MRLKENFAFARNALWALLQFHPWSDRREPFLTLDANGEPLDKEYVKKYFREWVALAGCVSFSSCNRLFFFLGGKGSA